MTEDIGRIYEWACCCCQSLLLLRSCWHNTDVLTLSRLIGLLVSAKMDMG